MGKDLKELQATKKPISTTNGSKEKSNKGEANLLLCFALISTGLVFLHLKEKDMNPAAKAAGVKDDGSTSEIDQLKALQNTEFEMKDLKATKKMIGTRISRDRSTVQEAMEN
ncbi:hypothetical protein RJ639_022232 [Escallonia herrerae]|uniref:Uncharacterized protein n=1 Tax=Escallonia herrerae TaxID=1293975 RepID=A0AA89AFN6_9ASTE|nr:hypothetical protein RJ639_022232 [Escallonia herrerae]